MKIRKTLQLLSLLLCSLIIALLLSEICFRLLRGVTGVYYPVAWSSPAIFVETNEGYALLNNRRAEHYGLHGEYIAEYGVNSQGIRSATEYDLNKPTGVKRIFVSGDSLVFGIGVDDNQMMSQVLESKLNRREAEAAYEVFNLGVTGYTFDNSYLRLIKYLPYKPDLLVFVVLGVNDFADIVDHEWIVDEGQNLIGVKESFRHINEYNRLVNGPKQLYRQENSLLRKIREFLRENSVAYTYLGTLRYRNRQRGIEMDERHAETDSETQGINRAKDVLNQLFTLCNDQGIDVIIVFDGFHNQNLKAQFLEYLTSKTGHILDLAAYDEFEEMRFDGDGHWTVTGNDYVAEVLFQYIKENQLI